MSMKMIVLCATMIAMILGAFGCENLPLLPGQNLNLRVNASLDRSSYHVNETADVKMLAYLDDYSSPVETRIQVMANGQNFASYDTTLQPGQNVIEATWGPFTESQIGSYEITFIIDPDSLVEETIEDDNTYTTNAEIMMAVPPCGDECGFSGMQVCTGNNTYKPCGQFDADSCLDLGASTTCPPGQICSGTGCNPFVPPTPPCTDTDGGKFYSTFGSVCNSTGCMDDVCQTETILNERFCYSNLMQTISMTCENGCSAGKCLSELPCEDTDNGKNYNVSGMVCNSTGCINDTCTTPTILAERYCSIGRVKTELYNCQSGCSNQACLNVPISSQVLENMTANTCKDSDSGAKFPIYGIACAGGNCYNDTCYNSSRIIEKYCASTAMVANMTFTCVNGCSNGRCLVLLNCTVGNMTGNCTL